MNDLIQELLLFLSQDTLTVEDAATHIGRNLNWTGDSGLLYPLTVEDAATHIGPVARDPGVPMPLELRPVIPGVRSARLSRYPDSGLPYVLTLELASDAQPTVASLKATLGDYHQTRTDRGRPAEVIFYPPAMGTHWNVTVIARLAPTDSSLDDAKVTNLALRRDPVTLAGDTP